MKALPPLPFRKKHSKEPRVDTPIYFNMQDTCVPGKPLSSNNSRHRVELNTPILFTHVTVPLHLSGRSVSGSVREPDSSKQAIRIFSYLYRCYGNTARIVHAVRVP